MAKQRIKIDDFEKELSPITSPQEAQTSPLNNTDDKTTTQAAGASENAPQSQKVVSSRIAKRSDYIRIDLRPYNEDYKPFLEAMAYKNHISVTQYIQDLIKADMEANKKEYDKISKQAEYQTYIEREHLKRKQAEEKRQALREAKEK